MRPLLPIALFSLLLLPACGGETPAPAAEVAAKASSTPTPDAAAENAPPESGDDARIVVTAAPPELRGRVAAHWFGRQWPKNMLTGFRREHVDTDFRQLAADGFDTVILLVAWGDFQPVADPCCTYDERAFERLRFLLERADAAKLKVMLRIGYGWSFHPQAGDVGERQQQLLNRTEVRAAYAAFVRRLADELAGRDEVVMTFMSWEDQWLRRIDESARADYNEFLATLPADAARGDTLPDPATDALAFHGYWDWLVREKLYLPSRALLPNLSYEARIDREPRWETGADGKRTVVEWIAHDGMTILPEGSVLTLYWAPFWGALNQGERLPASRSLELLAALLDESRRKSGRPLFIDQFNIVDNTPGHEANAVLKSEEIPAFLHRAVCTMRTHDVVGYGLWTARDYAESPLHNPAFGYGLEAWTLERDGDPEAALEALPSGDFQLRLAAGDLLAQSIPQRHGRLPRAGDAFADRTCVEADVRRPGTLQVRAGGKATTLAFDATGLQRRCADLDAVPADDRLDVALRLRDGDLALRDVQVFDHVQYGGLYDLDGKPGPLLEPVRRMNADFRAEPMPARCVEKKDDSADRA